MFLPSRGRLQPGCSPGLCFRSRTSSRPWRTVSGPWCRPSYLCWWMSSTGLSCSSRRTRTPGGSVKVGASSASKQPLPPPCSLGQNPETRRSTGSRGRRGWPAIGGKQQGLVRGPFWPFSRKCVGAVLPSDPVVCWQLLLWELHAWSLIFHSPHAGRMPTVDWHTDSKSHGPQILRKLRPTGASQSFPNSFVASCFMPWGIT